MSRRHHRLAIAAGVASVAALSAATASAGSAHSPTTGPSSSQSPYVVPTQPGVFTRSILTVGDSVGDYRMTGVPDGLGAFDNGDGTFTLLMDHELKDTAGATHAHGAMGAFVSKWTVRKRDLEVTAGEDLIKRVATWDAAAGRHNSAAAGIVLARLCSADLPAASAILDRRTGLGYPGRIFLSGEENGTAGRAFAHVVTGPDAGTSYELPHLGKFSFENVVANPGTGAKTVVVGTDDTTPGALSVYEGVKRRSGNAAERAGLVGGTLGGIRVAGFPAEDEATGIPSGTRFDLADHGDVSGKNGETLQSERTDQGVTKFLRPEDASWDPSDPSKLYFVTTDSFEGHSRLWRLNFDDPADPSKGGTIDMLLAGDEGQHMMDNITLDRRGHVLIQEDPGGNPHLAKIHRYDIATDTLTTIAQHDPSRFDPAQANPLLTQDEESSGILDVSQILGDGWFLGDVQAHYANPEPQLVEGGQLFALRIPTGRNGHHDDHGRHGRDGHNRDDR